MARNTLESVARLVLFDDVSIAAASYAESDLFLLRKSSNASLEWEVTNATFDAILQFQAEDGTWLDGDAGGENNADISGSTVLTAEVTARGVISLAIPYWAHNLRLRVNNDNGATSIVRIILHRDVSLRRS